MALFASVASPGSRVQQPERPAFAAKSHLRAALTSFAVTSNDLLLAFPRISPDFTRCTQGKTYPYIETYLAVYATGQLAQWQYSKENNIAVKTLSRGSEPCAERAGCRSRRAKGGAGIYSLTELGREVVLSALSHWQRALERSFWDRAAPGIASVMFEYFHRTDSSRDCPG
jgi:hypothetical protein